MSQAARLSLIKTLIRHDVRFVLIGGMAVAAHGHVRATKDVDLIYDTAAENVDRFAVALDDLGAEVIAADTLGPAGEITPGWLAQGGHLIFATDQGKLDTLSATHGLSYPELAATAIRAELADGATVLVCSYDHLMLLKQSAGRAQDLADIEALRAIRGES